MSDAVAVRVRGVRVQAGGLTVLDDVAFTLAPGRVLAVVGANGAGKTTLLDAIAGDVRIDAGGVEVGPRLRVGRVFQGSPLPATLTAGEIAALAAGGRAAGEALLARFGLAAQASAFVAELSTGMRRILDLALATAAEPGLLLLDEPTSGLAEAEVEQLVALVDGYRRRTGAAIVLVEHDASVVRAVADDVLVLSSGRVVARGTPAEVLAARPDDAPPRVRAPSAGALAVLREVAAGAEPVARPVRRHLSTWTLVRLGLRQFAAGIASVLILGVLNRVMKIELGISLGVVAAVLASYNLAAPFAIAIGHRSDTHPIGGRRRTPYILAGAALTGLAVAAAPSVARMLAGGVRPAAVTAAVALFATMGVGMYGSGTVFFALLADLAPEPERGQAASIVYVELMAGILAGVGLTGVLLDNDAGGLGTLFGLAGLIVFVLTAVAVWGQDRTGALGAEEPPRLREAVRGVAAIPQARLFFVFVAAATLFLFLQQAILEPFGGDVLSLNVRQTAAFNAVQTAGILIGMLVAGRAAIQRAGHLRIARAGLVGAAVAFAALSAAAAARSGPPAWLAIFAIGLGAGLFNVATLALMMGMAAARRTALFMGAWSVAHALADGVAVAGGGALFELARTATGGVPGGYAAVFAVEAAGLLACYPLLSRIDPGRFTTEAASSDGGRSRDGG